MTKRLLLALSLLVLAPMALWMASPSPVVAEEKYQEGVHYDLINPVLRTAEPDKNEVDEFFCYGFGHC